MGTTRATLRDIGKKAKQRLSAGKDIATSEMQRRQSQAYQLAQFQKQQQETTNPTDETKKVTSRSQLWQPDADNLPQQLAYLSEATVIGYGGQAGGGKSDLGCGLAITAHERSVIFRRHGTEVPELFDRCKAITDGYRVAAEQNQSITLPEGQRIFFEGLDKPGSWLKHQGRARDLFFFDEATSIPKNVVLSCLGWLRSAKEGQRTRGFLTFNPPTTEEGKWVLEYFAAWLDINHPNPAKDGEIRWYATVNGKEKEFLSGDPVQNKRTDGRLETIYPQSRTFFRARLEDNKYLDRDNEYRRQLNALPEPIRSQVLYGEMFVQPEENPWQVIPTAWIYLAVQRWQERGGRNYQPDSFATALGADIARGGKDRTIIAKSYGDFVLPLYKYEGKETKNGPEAADKIYSVADPGTAIFIDVIGYGASAVDSLIAGTRDDAEIPRPPVQNVTGLNFSAKSDFKDRSNKFGMLNKRSEAYWRLREALDPDYNPTLCLPPDNQMIADLSAPVFHLVQKNLIQIESKDEIKKRLHRSPDSGDSVAYLTLAESGWGAFYVEIQQNSDEDGTELTYDHLSSWNQIRDAMM
jgi:hypothetical protein